MSVLLRVLLLVLLVGLGFYAERHYRQDIGGFFQVKTKAPMPKIAVGDDSQAAYGLSRKQMEMTLAQGRAGDKPRADKNDPGLLSKSLQLVVVTASGWEDGACQMQRYRRPLASMPWEKVGLPAPCVLGKSGLAAPAGGWAGENAPEKKDGDGKTLAGLFTASQGFGFKTAEEAKNLGLKLTYSEIGDNLVCVSDPKSPQLNKLIAPGTGKTPRGVNLAKAGEVNRWGLVLGAYEQGPPPGNCQLVQLWTEPGKPTGGNIGCHEARVLELLAWLDPSANPAVAVLPAGEVETMRAAWGLP
jgi:L,D-peptidoglycan transpeptidase YkuD (ErfK/YbiS/YcfS/YnhG family)